MARRPSGRTDLRVGDMRVVHEFPPNYAAILDAIPAVAESRPIFAWGTTIYNPHDAVVDPHLHAHESLHGMVQHPAAGGPGPWWDLYLSDPGFRLREELEAYRLQLESYGTVYLDRERRHRYALALAGHLSSPLYGLGITRLDAYRRITA